jgi:hypothetical protein
VSHPSLQPAATPFAPEREEAGRRRFSPRWRGVVLGLAIAACTPTVEVVAPKEPITINLNIKLDADVRLQIEEKAKEDVGTKPIF